MASTTDPVLDLRERGRGANGAPAWLDRRLYFHLTAFSGCLDTPSLVEALNRAGSDSVLYENVNDPRGVAVLAFSEDPADFTEKLRPLFNAPPFRSLTVDTRFAMLGRTYSIGYETDLAEVLVDRPRERVLNRKWPWAVWYPLRRSGAFARLPADEQRAALMEHATIGRQYGEAGHAVDIRLASHGLDTHDHDFVVGLLGAELHPLSALVHSMRQSVQTSLYVEHMGPFFVGRAVRQGMPT